MPERARHPLVALAVPTVYAFSVLLDGGIGAVDAVLIAVPRVRRNRFREEVTVDKPTFAGRRDA